MKATHLTAYKRGKNWCNLDQTLKSQTIKKPHKALMQAIKDSLWLMAQFTRTEAQ